MSGKLIILAAGGMALGCFETPPLDSGDARASDAAAQSDATTEDLSVEDFASRPDAEPASDAAAPIDALVDAARDAAPGRYVLVQQAVDGREAPRVCEGLGMRLAIIDTATQNDEVRSIVSAGNAWISARSTFDGWNDGEPSGDGACVQMQATGFWNDINCAPLPVENGFHTGACVCER